MIGNLSSPDLWYVVDADPIRDAQAAFRGKDRRFIAVDGLGRFVPYIDENHPSIRGRIAVKPITGTGDAVHGYWEERANVIAQLYAETYNAELYEQLRDANELP